MVKHIDIGTKLRETFVETFRKAPELWIAIGALLAIGLALLPLFQYQLNPDAVSYISIAEKYADGNIRHAVNGYWGPALSWALAIFGLLGFDNYVVVAKCLQLLCGVLILDVLHALSINFKVDRRARTILYIALVPVLLNWALTQPITADLPFAAALCFLALRGARFLQDTTLRQAILLGLASWLLYISKPVGFYIALVNLLLIGALLWVQSNRRQSFSPKHVLIASAIFIGLSAPWVGALSLKYHHLTVATSTKMNHALVGPTKPINPFTSSIIPPSNPTAVSSWEDPSHYVIKDWSVFGSFSNFYFFVGLVLSNIYFALTAFNFVTLVGGGLLIGLLCLRGIYLARHTLRVEPMDYLLLLALLGIMAYAPILVLERYIYGSIILCLFLAFVVVSRWPQLMRDRRGAAVLAAAFILTTWYPAIVSAHNAANIGKSYYLEARALKPYIPAGSAVASNTSDSLFACYYNDLHCYGVVLPSGRKKADAELYKSLRGFGVTYIIDNQSVSSSPHLAAFLKTYADRVTQKMVVNPGNPPYNVTVYKLK